jgi:hypothetical protein
MKTIALGIIATTITAAGALAGDEPINKNYNPPAALAPCFRDRELQLDVFGSFMNLPYGSDRYDRGDHRARDGGGGGVGVNYFFTRFAGLGVDGDFDSNRDGAANYTGKLILRLPIEHGKCCFAPYIFGGGGGESFFGDDDRGFGGFRRGRDRTFGAWMCGGGIEWRITPRFGIFAEGRYTWTARQRDENGFNFDNDLARLGFRVAF